jgi:hypothetical protein
MKGKAGKDLAIRLTTRGPTSSEFVGSGLQTEAKRKELILCGAK